jgi:hypothetical protein
MGAGSGAGPPVPRGGQDGRGGGHGAEVSKATHYSINVYHARRLRGIGATLIGDGISGLG